MKMTPLFRLCAVAALAIGLPATLPLSGWAQTQPVLSKIRPSLKGDLPNFAPVSPGIYRGAAPTTAGLKKLRAMGIRTVIDLRISPKQVKQEKQIAEQLGFKWINLPMGAEPPTSKQVKTLLATLKQAPNEPVFVHCQHGADRTGCMLGIWRITQEGWSYPEAWKEMRYYGFNPHWKLLTGAVQKAANQKKAAVR